jgi:hypothetical protein
MNDIHRGMNNLKRKKERKKEKEHMYLNIGKF